MVTGSRGGGNGGGNGAGGRHGEVDWSWKMTGSALFGFSFLLLLLFLAPASTGVVRTDPLGSRTQTQ